MRKLSASALLLLLMLPYARAPLCEAGRHEHPGDAHEMEHEIGHAVAHAAAAAWTAPSDAPDCHAKMRCEMTADLAGLALPTAPSVVPLRWATDVRIPDRPTGVARVPESPPPRTV